MTAVSADRIAEIRQILTGIEAEEGATILLAVESGSRAWGFHSQDSDYDVRFVYARPVDWHLSVYPGRDVIERPIDAELDLGGWDLRKALGLILKSNAVILEWLQSPIEYRGDAGLRCELLEFCGRALRPKALRWHYLRLGTRQWSGIHLPDGRIKLKRYFYALRPALALRWLRINGQGLVPMHMSRLMDETGLPAPVLRWIDDLIATKRETGEMGTASTAAPAVDALIRAEFEAAERLIAEVGRDPGTDLRIEADALLCRWVHRVTP